MKKGREVDLVDDVLPATERLYKKANRLSRGQAFRLVLLLMNKFNITIWEIAKND